MWMLEDVMTAHGTHVAVVLVRRIYDDIGRIYEEIRISSLTVFSNG
jgi:hypothetical protein